VNVSREETRRAATLQEMFDVGIFGLPWNSMAAGHRIEHHEVSRLARRYRGSENRLVDYYDIPELPRPYDVLASQHQNLAWGSRVRSRYGNLLTIALVGWSSLGLVMAAAAGLTVSQLILAWFIPSLGGLMMGVDIYREQREVIEIRTRALHLANERIAAALHASEPDPALEQLRPPGPGRHPCHPAGPGPGAGVVLPLLPSLRPGRLPAGHRPAFRAPHRPTRGTA